MKIFIHTSTELHLVIDKRKKTKRRIFLFIFHSRCPSPFWLTIYEFDVVASSNDLSCERRCDFEKRKSGITSSKVESWALGNVWIDFKNVAVGGCGFHD